MSKNNDILQEIETENFIWIIYLFIIGFSFVANAFEKDYYTSGNVDSKDKYRIINIVIFGVALLIYIYFFNENYKTFRELSCFDSKEKIHFNQLSLVASFLIVIAGAILLYIAIFDENLDAEIGFN